MTGPLTRTRALLALLALGGIALATASATWLTTEVATALRPDVTVSATGTEAAPVVSAAALVLLACGPALALTGRAGRYIVLAVAALAGAGVSAAALAVVGDPSAAGTAAAAEAAGVTALAGPVVLSPWPWTTAATGALACLVAVTAVFAARHWPQTSRRHERGAAPSETPETPDHPADDWDALTRGEDPTRDER